jgi:tetratricopeptide (TPR) repeat protein
VGRFDDAKEYVAKALSIAREIGDDYLAARALSMLSVISIGLGSVASAQGYAQEALALARDLKDKAPLVRALNAFGEVYRWAGDLEAAQPLYDESLALGREEGDLAQIAMLSSNLARVLIAKGAAAQARDRVREALKIAEGIGSKWAAQDALDVTAALGSVVGEWMFAARISGAAESHYKEAGSKRDSVDGAFLAPLTLRIREALGDAAYIAAFDAGCALSHEQAVAEALAWLGQSADA